MYKLIELDSIDSTNKYSKENIKYLDNATVVSAKEQVAGKGRNQRVWMSCPENALLSIILKPSREIIENDPITTITQYMSLVIVKTFSQYGIESMIKWPNDVLVDGKKISGILSELIIKENIMEAVIIGVGVNLNLTPEIIDMIDKPATSLNLLLKKHINRKKFIKSLLENFFIGIDAYLSKGFTFIKEEYVEKSICIGQEVSVTLPVGSLRGFVVEIDDNGFLNLETQGKIKRISTGDLVC